MAKKEKHAYLGDPVYLHTRSGYVTLCPGQTVEEALTQLRNLRLTDGVLYFYVVDVDGKLVGVVPVRRLLTSQLDMKISALMIRKVISCNRNTSVMSACEQMMDQKLLALPVVDREGRFVGVVDIKLFTDEVWGATQRRRADDVFQLIGMHLAMGRGPGAWKSFKERFQWLLCNIGGGLACAIVASFYASLVSAVTLLAFFIPVVLTLAESVSMQSMTLTLQMLPRRQASWHLVAGVLERELFSATLLGITCGGVVGAVALCWRTTLQTGFVIGASICLAIISACVLGVAIPVLTRSLRVDPKVAAGPVILASADIVTVLLYFNLAGWLLG